MSGSRICLAIVAFGTCRSGGNSVDGVAAGMTAGATQGTVLVAGQAAHNPDSILMKRVKLVTAPLILTITWQSLELQRGSPLSQFFRIQSGPLPLAIDHRITKRPAVRSANSLSVIQLFVTVVMAFGTGLERSVEGAELCAAMFAVTGHATYSSIQMR